MTSDTDQLLLGGASAAVTRLEALSPDGSAETGNTFKLTTQRISPQTASGDAEFRRIYITISYDLQVRLRVVPLIDGVASATTGTIIGTGGPRKETFMLSLGRLVPGRTGAFGIRGASLQVQIEGSFADQKGVWHIDAIEVAYKTGHRARYTRV